MRGCSRGCFLALLCQTKEGLTDSIQTRTSCLVGEPSGVSLPNLAEEEEGYRERLRWVSVMVTVVVVVK